MDLFLSQPRGFPSNLPRSLLRITKLYRAGYLTDDSQVWVNANTSSPIFWTFSGIASCIWWFDAPTAGNVRFTQGRIRWAPTYDGASKEPHLDLNLRKLNGLLDDDTRLTFVVDHTYRAPTEQAHVGVVDDSYTQKPVSGYYEGPEMAMVDLPNFSADALPTLSPTRAEYESGLAKYHGVRLLVTGMSKAEKANVFDNTDAYCYRLGAEVLQQLVLAANQFDIAADSISDSLFATSERLASSQFAPPLATG